MSEELTKNQLMKREREYVEEAVKRNVGCARCNTQPSEFNPLTIDHIIPDFFLSQFGFDANRLWDEENIQVLCRRCNQFKSCKLDLANPKTKSLLLKYLALIP